jgi:hypothetical protein
MSLVTHPRRASQPVGLSLFGAAVGLAVLLAASPAGAQCLTSSDCLWPSGCAFANPVGVAPVSFGSVAIRNLQLVNAPPCTPTPPSGNYDIDSFFDVFVELSLDGGSTWALRTAPASGRSEMSPTTPPGSNPRLFDTEMLQMTLTGGTLPGGMMLRESATLPSRGLASNTQSGGSYQVDSFFDVFTDLSLDGGLTWTPGSNSSRVVLGPTNPTPARRSTWGSVKSIYR